MKKLTSSLFINDLTLKVNLGWTLRERSKKQTVWLSLIIFFLQPPKACLSDRLEDTFCYSMLIEHIQKRLAAKKYHLIEHLAHDIYKVVNVFLAKKMGVQVKLTKHPRIKHLTGGVCFQYGDNS